MAEAEVSAEGAAVAEVGGDLVGEEFIGPYQPRYFHSPIMQPMREGTVTAHRQQRGRRRGRGAHGWELRRGRRRPSRLQASTGIPLHRVDQERQRPPPSSSHTSTQPHVDLRTNSDALARTSMSSAGTGQVITRRHCHLSRAVERRLSSSAVRRVVQAASRWATISRQADEGPGRRRRGR